MKRFAKLLKIYPGEERIAYLITAIMLFTSAGFTFGNTATEALFLARYGVKFLPQMYMMLGVLSFFVTLGITVILGHMRHETLFVLMPIAMAGLLAGGWGLLFTHWKLVYPILWLGMAILDSLINLLVWGLAGLLCDTRQSKRLFPLFNTGNILGSVIGGFSTGLLVHWIGTESLLLVMAGTMLITFVFGSSLIGWSTNRRVRQRRSRRSQAGMIAEMQRGYQFVRRSELMRLVSVSAVLFSVLYFSIALPFSKAATLQFVKEDSLATFLGVFNAWSTAAAFLASLFLANRLFARFGIMSMILALPMIYFIGFGMLAIENIFFVIVAFRFFQTMWINGIASSAWAAMFNPVPSQRRDQVRIFVEGVPSKAGTFIAGAILFVGEQAFSSQQLYLIGLLAAAITCVVIWRASRAYRSALVEALRAGQPTLFTDEEKPFGIFRQDAATIDVALEGITNPDPLIRRTSAEILGHLDVPRAQRELVLALEDPISTVRSAALQSLAQTNAPESILEVAGRLNDPAPEVRIQAIDTLCGLTDYPHGLRIHLEPLLKDPDWHVRCRAAAGILKLGIHQEARDLIRTMATKGAIEERISAIEAMAEWDDIEAYSLIKTQLDNTHNPSKLRSAAAQALGSFGPKARSALINNLENSDPDIHFGAVQGLIRIGFLCLDEVLPKLMDPAYEDGVLQVLEALPFPQTTGQLLEYAERRIASALRYDDLSRSISEVIEPSESFLLLADSLRNSARNDSLKALKALSLLNDRETISVAMSNLRSRDALQRANALETLETVRDAKRIRGLLRIWETDEGSPSFDFSGEILFSIAEQEPDQWLRACATFAINPPVDPITRERLEKIAASDSDPFVRQVAALTLKRGDDMETTPSLSTMERILFLRRVSLLADLSPADLKRVAAIATEHHFLDGEVIFEQEEPGEEMFVVVSGVVRVVVHNDKGNKEVARRKSGDVVGEMSVISGNLRSASLIADGDVHLLCLDQKSFEGLLRERPEVSLAVIRMLCERLQQATHREDARYS